MKKFQGKVALITGASLGIGRGIALGLAAEGADIVVNYRSHLNDAHDVAENVSTLGQRALVCQADVADRSAVEQMFNIAVEHFGQIDIVVANAAMSVRERVIDAQWENVRRTIEVSQFGVFHTCQFAAQQMVKQSNAGCPGGKIIIISSILEELAPAANAAYNMSKAAINHLGRTLALELAPHHINVNMINPGWIDTPGERAFASESEIQAGGKRIPWGRLGTADDVAKAVAYLASEDADYVTGATLRIDGGFVLGLTLPEAK
ncbi:MAG: glucose 1-dehydrogenase [Chloroflexi bacterium]|nr:glucose 1-dehydrogenase [Chloroflexota bacterium]